MPSSEREESATGTPCELNQSSICRAISWIRSGVSERAKVKALEEMRISSRYSCGTMATMNR